MEKNRYQPPKSGFNKPPRDREPGSIVKAVLLGAATDIGGSLVLQIILSIVYSVVLASQGLSETEVQTAFEHIDPWSPLGLTGTVIGLIMSGLGGFVCARTANVASYNALGILSAISVAFGTFIGMDDYEWQVLLLLNLLGLAAIFMGGWWYIRRLAARS